MTVTERLLAGHKAQWNGDPILRVIRVDAHEFTPLENIILIYQDCDEGDVTVDTFEESILNEDDTIIFFKDEAAYRNRNNSPEAKILSYAMDLQGMDFYAEATAQQNKLLGAYNWLKTHAAQEEIPASAIDKVTTSALSAALRLCNIQVCPEILDRIIDLTELIMEKEECTLKDVENLEKEWK